MDILAARKKAAEREKALKDARGTGPMEQPSPSAETTTPQQEPVPIPPAAASPEPIVQAAVVESGSGAGAMIATVEPAAGHAPAGDGAALEPDTEQAEVEMLSFLLGGEEYAVWVEDVREILKVYQLTRVPNMPDYILGIMSLRGTVLPLYDLRLRLGLPAAEADEKARIVVVSPDDEQAGLLVDRVTGVFRIRPDAIRPTPENITQGAEYLRGIVRKKEKLCIVLDLEKALS